VCVCTCLSGFTCVLVAVFCPPPPTITTVLPIPHPVCTSSPHFAKFVSSGSVCGNVLKTGSVGLTWAKNTPQVPPPMPEPPPPPPPPTTHVLFLGDSVEGRRNFAHVNTCWPMKCRPGGRDMIPACAWPVLMLRGVSQPNSNAPGFERGHRSYKRHIGGGLKRARGRGWRKSLRAAPLLFGVPKLPVNRQISLRGRS
jgi:hypothetical protein